MNRSKVLLIILMFCSVMLVFYAAVQYVEYKQTNKEALDAEQQLGDRERENAELSLKLKAARLKAAACCASATNSK